MNFSFSRRSMIICAYLGTAVCGLNGYAARVDAQSEGAPAEGHPETGSVSTMQDANSAADEEIRKRVQAALHSDPYFYDAHVTVSVEKGDVVLRGFVSSDWDLRDAIRIASKAAGERRVIDNLSIKVGGHR
jgi:osmotically-inducible protein OsmY